MDRDWNGFPFSVSSGPNSAFSFSYEFSQPVVAALATAAATLSPVETTGVFPSHAVVGILKYHLNSFLELLLDLGTLWDEEGAHE